MKNITIKNMEIKFLFCLLVLVFTGNFSNAQTSSNNLEKIGSLINQDSIKYEICLGENNLGFSPSKIPCLINFDEDLILHIDDYLFLLEFFLDSTSNNDWKALILLESLSNTGGRQSAFTFNGDYKAWRKEEKWIDLNYWLTKVKFATPILYLEKGGDVDFINIIKGRIYSFEKNRSSNDIKYAIDQMIYLVEHVESELDNGKKNNNIHEILKDYLLSLKYLDLEICRKLNNSSDLNFPIISLIKHNFSKQNLYLYDYNRWISYNYIKWRLK
jgi:hypothetical protein